MTDRREFIKRVLAVPAVAVIASPFAGATVSLAREMPAEVPFRFKRMEANFIANALAKIPPDEEIMSVNMGKHGHMSWNASAGDSSLSEFPIITIGTWNPKTSMKRYVYTDGRLTRADGSNDSQSP